MDTWLLTSVGQQLYIQMYELLTEMTRTSYDIFTSVTRTSVACVGLAYKEALSCDDFGQARNSEKQRSIAVHILLEGKNDYGVFWRTFGLSAKK